MGKDVSILKCQYSPHIRNLRVHVEYRRLLRRLRAEIGETFLPHSTLVCAHPVYVNTFIATYAFNFPWDASNAFREKKWEWKREGCFSPG